MQIKYLINLIVNYPKGKELPFLIEKAIKDIVIIKFILRIFLLNQR